MSDAAEGPVTAARVEWTGARYRIHLVRGSGGGISVVDGGARPAEAMAALTARGVPAEDAEHCVREVEPGFRASGAPR
ncbi:hypothetical protein Aph02nite_08860 [Actinoplanes philippinensis]|uniref:Uncharacterized protein n=1 Tax=Actinoplanes philippinensis TaxID=35752 RepID=A0A1I2ADR0_9ACTN|nr:hypothetical protein [Actinoplanes philippinensis]GIE74936.1 hypothetical protein Aph02nite_08860 [Actinoplanes philippinensis]SFE42022.1 hypothetical protein SAMN05421541_101654 [Actinoplanes philippinensis]